MANLAVKPKIIIFLGSVRTGRMGERVSIFVRDTVEACGMEPIMFGNFMNMEMKSQLMLMMSFDIK
jgi:hypothetical protein